MEGIPDYETLMLPLLRLVTERGEVSLAEARPVLADGFGLTEAQRSRVLPSGRGTVFASRLGWARTYLVQAGLLASAGHGIVRATDEGRRTLAEAPPRLSRTYLTRFPSFEAFLKRSRPGKAAEEEAVSDAGATAAATLVPAVPSARSPEDLIGDALGEIEAALRSELLERLRAGPPAFFERVVLDLLRAMGYGHGPKEAARHLGRTSDGGVDGVIHEDRLGLDLIYVQAKRYREIAAVGVEEVRGFAGALGDKGSRKGVFVTTSHFTREAAGFAARQQQQRIVLIDGETLAGLMLQHGVGVRISRTVEIRRADADYFDPDAA